jgi:hypothetical protein
VRADYWIRPLVGTMAFVQYEQGELPPLAAGPLGNVTASLQITYRPQGQRNWGAILERPSRHDFAPHKILR